MKLHGAIFVSLFCCKTSPHLLQLFRRTIVGRWNFTWLFIGTGVSRKLLNFKHIGEIFIFNLKKNRFFSLKLHLNPVHDFGLQFLIVCVCEKSSVCQMEPVVPGSQAARQPGSRAAAMPLCVVRAQCVLSAAVSNSQLTWQQHPRSFTAADGGELAVRVCLPISFGEAAVGSKALPTAASSFMCRQQRGGGATIEIKLWSLKDQRISKKKNNNNRMLADKACVKISAISVYHPERPRPVSSESNPWDYIPAWWTMSILLWSCCRNPAQRHMQ